MLNKIKSVLFFICVVMVFTAQTNRPDDKKQERAPVARSTPAARQAPASHVNQSRPQVQSRRETPQQVAPRQQPIEQRQVSRPSYQESSPRVYAVGASAPVTNNRLLHRQHHNNWRPRYNYYDNQYHFYPYVNITSPMELSGDCISVLYNGQTFYYDQGTFYVQDDSGQYAAIAPPIGIIVSAIPPRAREVDVDGQTFYRYKGVFYVQVAQGYQVVGPVEQVPDNS